MAVLMGFALIKNCNSNLFHGNQVKRNLEPGSVVFIPKITKEHGEFFFFSLLLLLSFIVGPLYTENFSPETLDLSRNFSLGHITD